MIQGRERHQKVVITMKYSRYIRGAWNNHIYLLFYKIKLNNKNEEKNIQPLGTGDISISSSLSSSERSLSSAFPFPLEGFFKLTLSLEGVSDFLWNNIKQIINHSFCHFNIQWFHFKISGSGNINESIRPILQTAPGLLLFEVKFGQFSKCSNIDVLYIIGKWILPSFTWYNLFELDHT